MRTPWASALEQYQPGFSLPQAWYSDPEIYRRELDAFLLAHWLCVGHVSQIPNQGDYFLFEIDSESVIVQRRAEGKIGALANVCRHRGSRVCYEERGTSPRIV